MLRERKNLLVALVFAGDLLAVAASFYGAYFIRTAFLSGIGRPMVLTQHFPLLILALPAFALSFYWLRLYELFAVRSLPEELRQTVKACGWALLLLVVLIFLLKYEVVSRVYLATFAVLSCALLAGQRAALRALRRKLRPADHHYCNILVVGTDERARRVGAAVREHGSWGLRLIGHVQEDDGPRPDSDLPLCGTVGTFPQTMRRQVIDAVIFAVPQEGVPGIREAFEHCRQIGVPAYLYLSPFDEFAAQAQAKFDEIGGIHLISFPNKSVNESQALLKRAFDLFVSLLLLLLFGPLMLLIAACIKGDSPGPVFFRQRRMGMNGRLFTVYKFRTMIVGAEALRSSLAGLNEMDGPVFKMRRDPRVTRVGRFLRRTSLDELPQLFNVLAGHMSVVGPRPPLPEEVEKYEAWQRRRLSVRPGLTCLWQVSGRHTVDFQTWMELDLAYIDNWSWRLDLSILLRTIPSMFRGA